MPESKPTLLLQNRRVLVVEGDDLLAEQLRCGLEAESAFVMGPVSSGAKALALLAAEPAPDAAFLDLNLAGEMVFSVAEALQSRGIPYAFVMDHEERDIPDAYAQVPRFGKPVDVQQIVRWLGR